MYMVKAPVIPDMVKMRMAVPNDDFESGYFLTTDEIFPIPMPISKSNAFCLREQEMNIRLGRVRFR
jgi:hypothetical protein